jgi:trigger factor
VTEYPAQLGIGHLFPEFEKAIVGNPAGFTGRVEIAYPEDYGSEELAGRRIHYQFTIKEVKEKQLPALDDEFAASVDEKIEDLKGLREDIENRLRGEKEREANRKREERAIDLILERNPFEVPLTMIERYRKELEAEDDRRRQSMGAPPEENEEHLEQRNELFDKVATRNIKRYFVLERIAEREGVEVTDEELDAELEKIGEESGRPVEEVKKYFKKGSEQLSRLKNSLREQKIFKIILGTAQGG